MIREKRTFAPTFASSKHRYQEHLLQMESFLGKKIEAKIETIINRKFNEYIENVKNEKYSNKNP